MKHKTFFNLLVTVLFATNINAQKIVNTSIADSSKIISIAEVSCGECQFKMKGSSCDLAVRLNGKSYFVDGTKIDEHGDAHAKDGFCESVRKAEVQGKVINNRFNVTYFKLLPKD